MHSEEYLKNSYAGKYPLHSLRDEDSNTFKNAEQSRDEQMRTV